MSPSLPFFSIHICFHQVTNRQEGKYNRKNCVLEGPGMSLLLAEQLGGLKDYKRSDGNTRPPDLPLEKPTYMQVRKQQLELNMEQQTGSK